MLIGSIVDNPLRTFGILGTPEVIMGVKVLPPSQIQWYMIWVYLRKQTGYCNKDCPVFLGLYPLVVLSWCPSTLISRASWTSILQVASPCFTVWCKIGANQLPNNGKYRFYRQNCPHIWDSLNLVTPYILYRTCVLLLRISRFKQTSITLLESSTKSGFVHPLFLLVSKSTWLFRFFWTQSNSQVFWTNK